MLLSTAAFVCSLQGVLQGTLLVDLSPGGTSSTPRGYTRAASFVQFWSVGGTGETKIIWATDGTAAGTRQLKPAVQGTTFVDNLGAIGDRAFFGETDVAANTRRLWSTDGTPEGTQLFDVPVLQFSYTDLPLQVLGDRGYMLHRSQFPGFGLLKPRNILASTDGTVAATQVLETSPALGFDLDLQEFLAGEDRLWLRNRTDQGEQLFSTDGSPGAMQLEYATSDGLQILTTMGSRALFTSDLPGGGRGLASIEPGASSPIQLAVLEGVGGPGAVSGAFARTGNRLVLLNPPAGGAQQIVSTDGVTPGLDVLLDLSGYEPLFAFRNFAETSGRCAFLAQPLGASSSEVWFSDGTAAGTAVVGSLPITLSDTDGLTAVINTDERVLIGGRPAGQPARLWIADPTGTTWIAAVSEPFNGLSEASFWLGSPTVFGNTVLFTGRDASGYELHAIDLELTGGAHLLSVGAGCAAPGSSAPRIDSTGELGLGTAASFDLSGGLPQSTSLWFLDTALGGIGDLGSCTIALPNPLFAAQRPIDASGGATWDIQLPLEPSLLGVSFRIQTLAVELGGPAFGLGSLTNVLEIGLAP